MILLPVVERELRVASRRRGTHVARIAAAVLAFGIMAVMLFALNGKEKPAWIANAIFNTLAYGAFGIATISGVFLTADSLSEEKREGTLGLLFLTDLRGWDVVLGKLATTSLIGVYCLLAILPMLAIPVLFGGITPGQFVSVSVALLVTTGLSLGVGLLVSTLGWQARSVSGATLFLMLLLAGGLVGPVDALHRWFPMSAIGRWVGAFSPFCLLRAALSPTRGGSALVTDPFLLATGVHLVLLVASFVAASFLLPRRWQDPGLRSGNKRSGAGRVAERFGLPQFRRRLLDMNPWQWLVCRTTGLESWTAGLLLALGCAFLVLYVLGWGRSSDGYFAAAMFTAYGMHVIVKSLMAMATVRRICEDRASGAFELLLVTPLPVRFIIAGQRRALWGQWRWALVMLGGVNLLLLFAVLFGPHFNGRETGIFARFMLGGIPLLLMDVHAMGYVGTSMALRHAKPQRAALATLGRVLLPGIAGIFFIVLLGIGSRAGDDFVNAMHPLWFLGCLGVGAALAFRTRDLLVLEFAALRRGLPAGRSAGAFGAHSVAPPFPPGRGTPNPVHTAST